MAQSRPIRKLLCANRGEIAIRVFRAATELGVRTVAIFSHEDRVHLHRYKADEAYLIGKDSTPVGAYLNIEEIIQVAKRAGADAIHPGYGFLSERADFARACAEAGIRFVGPSAETIELLGDKTTARELAIREGVPVVPGSDGPVDSLETLSRFVEQHGLPVIIKAAHGGGGRGMRVVRQADELEGAYEAAQSEALSAFGNATVFVERFVDRPRHIEVQVLGDGTGETLHLFERDCSVQRRHQKVVEVAPALHLGEALRNRLTEDAMKLAKASGYENAGTVEFLVDSKGGHYFIEVNPRIQVEHTVTETCTGVDLVQTQIQIASGETLESLGLTQDSIDMRGFAIQCRITTEDPKNKFQPDTGRIEVFRAAGGMGIRLDGGSGYAGARVSPHYDSLLVKVTGQGLSFAAAADKVKRALAEFRIRGVKTNIPFLQNVLAHPTFLTGDARTDFIDTTPELFRFPRRRNRAQRALRFLGEVAVNGPMVQGADGTIGRDVDPVVPRVDMKVAPVDGLRHILEQGGPTAFAKHVRESEPLLLTDTTWRDAHQSLLATRVRTRELLAIAPATAAALSSFYSLEMWGGATFDVCLRFLRECPWDRLERLREQVPNIPLQMLLRGANAVGYTNYPDNVVRAFVRQAARSGVDVFRVFDCLNYVENLKLGIDAVGEAGGVIEAAICYTGDVSDATRRKYSVDYYLDLVGTLVERGIHVLAIKDMAGLLKPLSARLLVGRLREAFPQLPIHMHTHDTANTGVASMLAAAEAGADVVDVAVSSMAGLTSQPAMGAVVAALEGSPRAVQVSVPRIRELNEYWEEARALYSAFESGLKSGNSDVYDHEMPGGQYTNLQFQASKLGLEGRWPAIKRAYAAANRVLGDVIKVTPSSKVVGDLAQFMVQNDLDETTLAAEASTLSFPNSVVEFLQGQLGVPLGGFPEDLRAAVTRGVGLVEGRPGGSLPEMDLEGLADAIRAKHGNQLRDVDVLSAALYPQVFDEYMEFRREFSDISLLPTRACLAPMRINEELTFDIETGKTLVVKLSAVGELGVDGKREVYFELNGQPRSIGILDRAATVEQVSRRKADPKEQGHIGAPMLGSVIAVRVRDGAEVESGAPLLVLSAMKMETVVTAPLSGRVAELCVSAGDEVRAGDLLVRLAPAVLN
jgi:pyruvate carboxylase